MALANPCPESPIPWRGKGRERERERVNGKDIKNTTLTHKNWEDYRKHCQHRREGLKLSVLNEQKFHGMGGVCDHIKDLEPSHSR